MCCYLKEKTTHTCMQWLVSSYNSLKTNMQQIEQCVTIFGFPYIDCLSPLFAYQSEEFQQGGFSQYPIAKTKQLVVIESILCYWLHDDHMNHDKPTSTGQNMLHGRLRPSIYYIISTIVYFMILYNPIS